MSETNTTDDYGGLTLEQIAAVCGDANADADGATFEDVHEAFSNIHPAVAGKLVEHLGNAIDDGVHQGTDHPHFQKPVRRVLPDDRRSVAELQDRLERLKDYDPEDGDETVANSAAVHELEWVLSPVEASTGDTDE